MKLAIVGTHTIEESDENYRLMKQAIYVTISLEAIDEIVSGGAPGIDDMAGRFAEKHSLKMTVFPADWNKYGRSAGPRRNTLIIDYADLVIAFPDKQSVGTRDSIKKAKKQGKLLKVWNWETLQEEMNHSNKFTE
jgi:hypothetical protein